MKILELRALRGPNFYTRHPAIYMLLDIEELEATSSDQIPGLADALEQTLPSLIEHRCSPGIRGGFFERLREGTWAAHIVEHVAIELQVMAGHEIGFGKTRKTSHAGVYAVVFRYRDEEVGLQAGRHAVTLVERLCRQESVDVAPMVEDLRSLADTHGWGPSTGAVVREAMVRNIPVMRLDDRSFLQLGQGSKQQKLQATMTGRTSGMAMEIADDKDRTKAVLREAGVRVPLGETASTLEGAKEIAAQLGYPVVTKPLVGNHGRGITTNVRNEAELSAAFQAAKALHRKVVVEQYLEGSDFRILVIDHRFVAAARRDPAQVIGDGKATVTQLIESLNADSRRGTGHDRILTRVIPDSDTLLMLQRQGLSMESVPQKGQRVVLKSTANISSGGTATDVTDQVHPSVRAMSERVSRIIGLDIMGIDIVAPHLRAPLNETGGGIVEVNAAPGLRMHLEPAVGRPRNVAARIVEMLFPPGTDGRIPIIAITGTNGKTTTVRLVAHILRYHGARVGLASTGSVEINNNVVLEGDFSGPSGAQAVLRDPTVDHAVLEVARGGILRRGLGFDQCDVAAFLNVASDHLGEGEIENVDDLARLKATILVALKPTGTAVLNAEDERVMRQRADVRCRVILFALDPQCPAFRRHVDDGGIGVTVVDRQIVVRSGASEYSIASLQDIPVTMGGVARFNVQNVLASVCIAHALGLPDDVIAAGLATFNPTPTQLPGRMNLIDLHDVRVLIDYGHNAHALRALAEVIPHLASGRRINVGSASGNRRDEDLRAFGEAMASMYDYVFLCDPDPRARARGETPIFIKEGLVAAGFRSDRVATVLNEAEAIEQALDMAQPGDLVVLQVDDVRSAIRRVQARKEMAMGQRALIAGTSGPPVITGAPAVDPALSTNPNPADAAAMPRS